MHKYKFSALVLAGVLVRRYVCKVQRPTRHVLWHMLHVLLCFAHVLQDIGDDAQHIVREDSSAIAVMRY
jgi:hypothetical protein